MTASAQTTAKNTRRAHMNGKAHPGINPRVKVLDESITDAYDKSAGQPRPDAFDRLLHAANEALEEIGAPSPVRVMVACVAGTIAAAAGLYYGISATVVLTTIVAMATGSFGFLAFLTLFAGYLVSIIAAVQAGGVAYQIVTDPRCLVRGAQAMGEKVRGWFRRSDAEPALA